MGVWDSQDLCKGPPRPSRDMDMAQTSSLMRPLPDQAPTGRAGVQPGHEPAALGPGPRAELHHSEPLQLVTRGWAAWNAAPLVTSSLTLP